MANTIDLSQLKEMGSKYIEVGNLCKNFASLLENKEKDEEISDDEISAFLGRFIVLTLDIRKLSDDL